MEDSLSIAHSPNRHLSKLCCPMKSPTDVVHSHAYIINDLFPPQSPNTKVIPPKLTFLFFGRGVRTILVQNSTNILRLISTSMQKNMRKPDVADWKRVSLQKDKHPQSAALP